MIRLIIPYKHLYAQNLSRHIRICYNEKLFIIPYTHLYSQNNSDDVRFPFVRKLSFHDHQNMYVLTVNSHFIRLKTSLHHHVRFVGSHPNNMFHWKGCGRTGHWAEDYSKNRVPGNGGLWKKVKHLS